MGFLRKLWADGSGGATPITAAELNRLEAALAALTGAWDYLPEDFGAKADGKVCAVNTIASSTTVVATSAVFTSTAVDGGKWIKIHGANGSSSGPLITTISSVTDSTHAVLAAAPSSTVSACPAAFATDDHAAFEAAMDQLGSDAVANGSYFGRLVINSSKIYGLKGLTQRGNGTSTPTFNTHVPVPYPAANGTSPKLIVEIASERDNGYCQFWMSTTPNVGGGSLISFASTGTTEHATFGRQSVIGGPTGSAGFGGSFANTKVIVRNVAVWCPVWTNVWAFDFRWISAARAERSAAHIFAPTGANGGVAPYLQSISASSFLTSVGCGWAFPVTGNNADVTADDIVAEGYEVAFRVWDHFTAGQIKAIYSDVVMVFDGTVGLSGTSHGLFVQNVTAEIYNGGLLRAGGTAQVVMNWDAECSGVTYDFSDSGNQLFGQIRFRDPAGARTPVKVGGTNLTIVTDGP